MYSRIESAAQRVEVVETLRDLVRIPSVSPPGNEKPVAEYVEKRMKELEMDIEVQEVLPNRPNVIGRRVFDRGGPTLLFDAHTDVNPPGDEKLWSVDPFGALVKEGRVYGRGAADDKGSLAAMLAAIEIVQKAGFRLKGSLIMAAAMGEETSIEQGGGLLGAKHYVGRGLSADMAIVGEPTNIKVAVAHKGTYRPIIRVTGKAVHSGIPDRGVNAISKAAELVLALDSLYERLKTKSHPIVGHPTLVTTLIKGGVKVNTVPPDCEVVVDRRLIPGEDNSAAEGEILGVMGDISGRDPSFKAQIERVLAEYEPSETRVEERIVKLATEAVKQVTGVSESIIGLDAGCDMSPLVNTAGIPTVVMGPGDIIHAHVPDECVEIGQLTDAAKVYSLVIRSALAA